MYDWILPIVAPRPLLQLPYPLNYLLNINLVSLQSFKVILLSEQQHLHELLGGLLRPLLFLLFVDVVLVPLHNAVDILIELFDGAADPLSLLQYLLDAEILVVELGEPSLHSRC